MKIRLNVIVRGQWIDFEHYKLRLFFYDCILNKRFVIDDTEFERRFLKFGNE